MSSCRATNANPFRPGAGHPPPYLAGREEERQEFARLLTQDAVLDNLVLTGLRGVGKTVLLDTLKPIAQNAGWLWVGTDMSESSSVTEDALAVRLLTDLSTVTSSFVVHEHEQRVVGFATAPQKTPIYLSYDVLRHVYDSTPGLPSDKLKAVLGLAWGAVNASGRFRGIVFAYDEAQNMSDHAAKESFPLSLLLDVFQSVQRSGFRCLLVLTGLPTLFPKLVDARTYAERMFRVLFLRKLNAQESRDAITKPITDAACPVRLDEPSIQVIIDRSGGYPYFIQFICREVYDAFIANLRGGTAPLVPIDAIERKLDSDFFAGRWARATERQRDLLHIIATLPNHDDEFTVQEIVDRSKTMDCPFSNSHVNQMLSSLTTAGLVYKNRHGRYSFAVPLFGRFVLRQMGGA